MDLRKHFLEAVTLIAAAILCAVVSNVIASRERKLALVGSYPNAMNVPVEAAAATEPAPAAAAPVTSTATATVAVPTSTAAPITLTVAPAATSTHAAPPPVTTTMKTIPDAPAAARAAAAAEVFKRFPQHPDKAYLEIGYADAAALHAAGALFLDARRTSVFEQGHIAGARPYSVWESDVDEKVNKLFAERGEPDQQALPIVIYCSGGECEDSHMLAQKLWGIQFNNVYVYKDGYPDWVKHGAAVKTGGQP